MEFSSTFTWLRSRKFVVAEGLWIVAAAWVWPWVHTASGGGFWRMAIADAGRRSPRRRRFSTTSSVPFTGSVAERNRLRPRLLAKTMPVRDPCRSSISNIACASPRSLSGFTVQRTARRFSESSRPPAADPPANRAAQSPQSIRLSNVPESTESGRFEIRGFAGSSDPFSLRVSSSVSSFFQMRPNASGAHPAC